MGYGTYLKDLLAPLGVYRLEDTVNGAELESIGAALDGVDAGLEHLQREMLLATAQDEGLANLEKLLARRPVARTPEERRAALAALLRIGGDSFTLEAINDNLRGCGLRAVAAETGDPGRVEVRFPDAAGVPEGIEEMKQIIGDIIPCHLQVEYVYWYVTWMQIEQRFPTWRDLEIKQLTWDELERMV